MASASVANELESQQVLSAMMLQESKQESPGYQPQPLLIQSVQEPLWSSHVLGSVFRSLDDSAKVKEVLQNTRRKRKRRIMEKDEAENDVDSTILRKLKLNSS